MPDQPESRRAGKTGRHSDDEENPSGNLFAAEAYHYELPEDRIAQRPAARREGARLLVTDLTAAPDAGWTDATVADLPHWLKPGDTLVLNDTRVVPGRLFGVREATSGRVEALILRRGPSNAVEVLLKTRGQPRDGEWISLANGAVRIQITDARGEGVYGGLSEPSGAPLRELLDSVGRLPLPPYIRRDSDADPRDQEDKSRYQTVFGKADGAAAAPTAGLHLTEELLQTLAAGGVTLARVTLHVGLGTFRPVMATDIRDHVMHAEEWSLSPDNAAIINRTRAQGGRIVAVGTTSVRVLETTADEDGRVHAGTGETAIFLYPPYGFRAVDGLLTNFHAPGSSLLMLLAAFVGRERMFATYRHALAAGYRFLSYGDASLWLRPR